MANPAGMSSFYWTLLHMIDAGQTATVEDVYLHIRQGDTLQWVAVLAGDWEKRTGSIRSVLARPDFTENVNDMLERHQNATLPSDLAVSANGLCLLLGYCIDELQIEPR